MKQILLLMAVVGFTSVTMAQSERYQNAMQQNLIAVDTTIGVEGWKGLANSFQRIADAEKTQWLPYYYAAYAQVSAGFAIAGEAGGMGGFADKTDPYADEAEKLLLKAEALVKANSETYCVRKMIATLRMMADPMNRYQTQGAISAEALEAAKKMSPDNPRPIILEAQDKMFTPEQFGGSKQEAKLLFEEAKKKFEIFKPESSLHPNWGRPQIEYFLSQLK